MLDTLFFKRHLDDTEVLMRVIHKHWTVAAKGLFAPTIFFLLSLLLLLTWPKALALVIVLIVIGTCALWLLHAFFDFFLDAWLITDQAVIDLNWLGWFHRQSSRILYSDIQGVSYEIQGIWATIFHYGTISVEKISTGASVSLPCVFKPKEVESLILRCMEEYLHKKNLKNSKHVQEILAEYVSGKVQSEDAEQKVSEKKAS